MNINIDLLHSSIVSIGATHFIILGHLLVPSHIILTLTFAKIRLQEGKGCLNSAPIVAASYAAGGHTIRFQQRTPSAPVTILSDVSFSLLFSTMYFIRLMLCPVQ